MITTVSSKRNLCVYDTAPDESGQNVCVPATSGCILECTQFVLFPFLGTIDCLNNFTMEANSFHILSLQEDFLAQCARTDLNKRFLPKPMTTTG